MSAPSVRVVSSQGLEQACPPVGRRTAILAACHDRLVRRCLAGLAPATRPTAANGPLARPLAQLLVEDGDGRIRIDPATGENAYGCTATPWPEGTIELCSTTATAISDHAFTWTDRVRDALARAEPGRGRDETLAMALAEAVRREIRATLELSTEAVDVVLATSGTDTELLAVMLALCGGDEPLLSLLTAPEESGRGVELAGGGRFFDAATSLGAAVAKGSPVWPREDRRLVVARVAIRDAAGVPRPPAELDAEIEAIALRHLGQGGRVLVHVLLGSKTGLRMPGAATLQRLALAHPGRVDIVVDACQWRCPAEAIRAALRRGWMVQVTGSKFVGGPPFCGALLLPAALRRRAPAVGRLRPVAPITRPHDWPAPWATAIAPTRPTPSGLGALLRWVAAALELALLRPIPDCERAAVLRAFADAGRARLAASPCVAALPGPPADPSILALTVKTRDGQPADMGTMQRLCRDLARRGIRAGQPVALRPDCPGAPVALRLVAGARMLCRAHHDPEGGSIEVRLARQLDGLHAAIAELERLAGWPVYKAAVGAPPNACPCAPIPPPA